MRKKAASQLVVVNKIDLNDNDDDGDFRDFIWEKCKVAIKVLP